MVKEKKGGFNTTVPKRRKEKKSKGRTEHTREDSRGGSARISA